MGAYLSEPKTTKESADSESSIVRCGSSSMQGWRVSQEDAHNCILDYDKTASFFAVYDGHGGHEVAEYCSKYLPDFLKKMEKYTKKEFEEALKEAFLEFDATLTTPEVIEVLKTIAGRKEDGIEKSCGGADADSESEGEEAIDNLVEEAHMPLDEVIAKYAAAGPLYRVLKGEKGKPPVSPMLRGRREGGASCSGDGPSCSSASSSLSTNVAVTAKGDAEVSSSSSSSHSAPICNGESHTNGEVEGTESTKSEVSGSDGKIEKKVEVGKKTESAEAAGTSDVKKCERTEPDSSGPSNGECLDVSSSSENGSVSSSSSPSTRKKRIAPNVYQKLLQPDESESEDEDETFTAEAAESDEDSDEAGEGKREEDDEDEESSEEDDEDLDDEGDEDYPGMEVKEEPGSDSGCTAVVALLVGNQLYVANAGDSRCVLCRDGQAVELSFDHKPEDEPERERIQNAGGRVTCDGRVNGGLNLSRAIGDHSYKQVKDLSACAQMITALPDVKVETIDPEKDEFMVLACDGIWNSMTSQQVVDFVRAKLEHNTEKLSQICEDLFNVCLAPDTMGDGTGCDNMTCVIVQFKRPTSNKRPADEQQEEPDAKKSKVEEQTTSA